MLHRLSAWAGIYLSQGGPGMSGPGTGEAGTPRIEDLYKAHASSLYWICMKYVKNKEDAQDMVNQAFLKVQENLSGFRGQSQVHTWMYRIAVNQCLDLIRRRKFHLADTDWEDAADLLPVETENANDARMLLERLMEKADPETREIVFLLYLEGLTQEEVVAKLGISRTTVHRKVVAFKAMAEKYR